MTRFVLQVLLLLLVAVFAWRKGGKPERQVASIYLAMLVFGMAYAAAAGSWASYVSIPYYRVILDIAALLLVVRVALTHDRWWVLWVGSAQLLAVMAHFLRMAGMPLPPVVYAVMERWPVWLAIMLTGLGTWLHMRRTSATTVSS
jgi:hypothetical protein